jgi:hypothetical protein
MGKLAVSGGCDLLIFACYNAPMDVPENNSKPSRRRYQFSLRTMLVEMAVLSIPLAWAGYSLRRIKQRDEWRHDNWFFLDPNRVRSTRAPGGLWVFGEDGEASLFTWDKADAAQARMLFPEATIEPLTHSNCLNEQPRNNFLWDGSPEPAILQYDVGQRISGSSTVVFSPLSLGDSLGRHFVNRLIRHLLMCGS